MECAQPDQRPSLERPQRERPAHQYSAIRLTNYYSNLLSKHDATGPGWRTQQLARQMPQQDAQLLASGAQDQSAGDEIKFIRGQKRLAAQFSAALFYLSPAQSEWSRPVAERCFKCNRPIETGSTCVRVDNLPTPDAPFKERSRVAGRKATRLAQPPSEEAKSQTASSGDEGLGTGSSASSSSSSSAQSSSAGSHCDDRDTPPHVVAEAEGPPPSLVRPASLSNSCDNLHLSAESGAAEWRRNRSATLTGEEAALCDEAQRRRVRAQSWSASLSRSKSEHDLRATGSVLLHTDCFSCATCGELLVDLRALVYVNEPRQPPPPRSPSERDYVNLETPDEEAGARLGLYCHRHFVELFKPRCQQCDGLILDEECTEAEGKVWHIKHFCCTECRVPLGGQQYIIVDRSQLSGRLRNRLADAAPEASEPSQQENSPYCLKCFDSVFAESCEHCGKLITCDLGAINHEQRCWHASPSCFKCHQCAKSLLGSPFLPGSDGRIYCSARCSELSQLGGRKRAVGELSVASYSDPRAPLGALQNQLTLRAAGGARLGLDMSDALAALLERPALLPHRPLVEHLLEKARSDDAARQLLGHLELRFGRGAEPDGEQARLMAEAGQALEQIGRQEGAGSLESLSARRAKLNPFLIDSAAGERPPTVMDGPQRPGEAPAGYINLDSLARPKQQAAAPSLGPARQLPAHFKAAQCSPATSLASQEGALSDHSGTSSGVSTAPTATNSHSPLSSTSSHSSVGSEPARPAQPDAAQRTPLCSVTNTAQRKQRVLPVTELSVVELLSEADERLQSPPEDGYGQLVRLFEDRARQQSGAPAGSRQQFFSELEQRLPRPAAGFDMNGLPSVESLPTGRPITDHYSTVNKPAKPPQPQQQADDASRASFFAITSPLLACRSETVDGHANQPRPTSSLALLSPPASQEWPGPPRSSPFLLAPSGQAHQAGRAKPAKSVSFDPTVRDPPHSSGSMTLGRAPALKSALKTSGQWGQFPAASSATMPASLASQLRAAGSPAAYQAHYDEFGRRVRLSSLLSPPPTEPEPEPASSRSLLSGALSRLSLGSGSSRGGRREERKLRQQQQQQQVVQTQPLGQQQLFVQPVSPQPSPREPARRRHRHARSHRRGSSRRHSSHRTRHGRHSRRRARRPKYCDADCYDSDGSSRCSTCSSSSGSDSDSDEQSDDDRSSLSSASSCSSLSSESSYSRSCSSDSDSDSDSDSSRCSSPSCSSRCSSLPDSSNPARARRRHTRPRGGSTSGRDRHRSRRRGHRSGRSSSSRSSSSRASRRSASSSGSSRSARRSGRHSDGRRHQARRQHDRSHRHHLQPDALRAKSPSTLSMDSKAAGSDNCRII